MNSVSLGSKKIIPSKIVCVGKNYLSHIEEMGGCGIPKSPTIFLKPNSAIATGGTIEIPERLGLVHHEVELCFLVGRRCREISEGPAKDAIAAYGVGLDLTLRDLQSEAKKAGGPWALAKGFDSSAVFAEFGHAKNYGDCLSLDISLLVNGAVKQSSNTSKMIFKPAQVLSYVSNFMTIEEGDVFMCGTPEGVGPLASGDDVVASIESFPKLCVKILRN